MSAALELMQFLLGCTLCGLGFLLMLAGGLAGLRFPDFFTRLHAGGLSEVGHLLAFVGLACFASNLSQALLLLALGFGCLVFGAGARHALADGASAAGLEPQTARALDAKRGRRR